MISSPARREIGRSPGRSPDAGFLDLPSLPALLGVAFLGLLLFFAPTQLNGFWPADFNFWPQSLFSLCLALGAVLLAVSRLSLPKSDATCVFLAFFLGWSFLSALLAPYKHDALLELARLTGPLALFFLARALPEKARYFLLVALVLGLVWPATSAFFDFLQTRNARQFGPFNNPNYFAAALGAAAPFALVFPLAIWQKTRARGFSILASLPLVLLLFGLVSTGSKGGFLATLLALLATVWALKIARPVAFGRAFKKSLPLLLAGFLVFGAIAAKTVLPRLLQARGSDDNSTQFRIYLWRGTTQMAEASPIFGHGPGSFVTVYPRFAPAGVAKTAHQSWLQIAAETGFPSLLLLLLATGAALRNARKTLRTSHFLLASGSIGALAAIFFHGLTDAGWSTLVVPVVFALALAFCAPPPDPQSPEISGLNLKFLAGALLLGFAGYGSQIAAQSYDASGAAETQANQGLTTLAFQNAARAVEIEPGNARAWATLGRIQTNLGQSENALKSFETALALQPNRAFNFVHLARFFAATNPKKADAFYAQALARDPKNTRLLLERARFRLDSKSGDGYADLRQILNLWDAPYGKYPALADWINLDFARATILLWPRLSPAQKAKFKAKALTDIARAKSFQAQNQQILDAVGDGNALEANRDLPEIEAAFGSLTP